MRTSTYPTRRFGLPITQRRPRGFTLVELIVAIVILSVAVPPMLWAIRDAHASRVSPVMLSRARWLAGERLEDIIADRHSPSRGFAYVVNANYPSEPTVSGFPGFTRAVSIAETGINGNAGTGFKAVNVTITWVDGQAVTRTFTLGTVLTEYTP